MFKTAAISISMSISPATVQSVAAQIPAAKQTSTISNDLRDWTIKDSVAIGYFSGYNPFYTNVWPSPTMGEPRFIFPSPDGLHFFVISNRPNIEGDTNIFTLTVYSCPTVLRGLSGRSQVPIKPVAQHHFESASSKLPALLDASWQDEGRSITFTAVTEPDGVPQFQRLDIETDKITVLAKSAEPVTVDNYRGGGVLYSSLLVAKDMPSTISPMVAVPRDPSGLPIIFRDPHPRSVLRGSFEGGATYEFEGEFAEPLIAPNGRSAVALETQAGAQRFVLLDLIHGTKRTLIGVAKAQQGAARSDGKAVQRAPARAIWTADGSHLVLVGAQWPAEAQRAGNAGGNVVSYEVSSNRWVTIAPMVSNDGTISAVGGLMREQALVVTRQFGGATSYTAYRRRDAQWHGSPIDAEVAQAAMAARALSLNGIKVFVRESANEPPVLMVSNGRVERALTESDPALQGVRITKAEPIQFLDPGSGKLLTGKLLLPHGRKADETLPVVVLIEGALSFENFLPDGDVSAAFSAQLFAAQGYAVMEIPHILAAERRSGIKESAIIARFEAALDALSARQLIDRNRIAAIGHSRTGFQVQYIATHPDRTRPAAIIAVDSTTVTFGESLMNAAHSGLIARGNGIGSRNGPKNPTDKSFWDDKAGWLEHENLFNLDRSRTPALLVGHFPPPGSRSSGTLTGQSVGETVSRSTDAAMIGAYNLANIPLEYVWLPEGYHYLLRPTERVAEMGLALDWVNFWLKGKSPADPERAARWAPLRKQQAELMKRPLPPKGKWKFVADGRGAH